MIQTSVMEDDLSMNFLKSDLYIRMLFSCQHVLLKLISKVNNIFSLLFKLYQLRQKKIRK